MKVLRKFVDWESTGFKLFRLRTENANLRRYVCSALKRDTDKCLNKTRDCATCDEKNIDKSISRAELGQVFNVSESVINNWESGRTEVGIDDLLFYLQISQVPLNDVLVYIKDE